MKFLYLVAILLLALTRHSSAQPGDIARNPDCQSLLETIPQRCDIEPEIVEAVYANSGELNNTVLFNTAQIICNDGCGQFIYDFLLCNEPTIAEIVNIECALNENNIPCYEVLFPTDETTISVLSVFANCGAQILRDANCTENCMQTLQNWKARAGCCHTSFYGAENLADNTFIQALIADEFWEIRCGTEQPPECPNLPFSSGIQGSAAYDLYLALIFAILSFVLY